MKITIDGPAGSGKSTIARELAKRLGFVYINSGLFYRQIAKEVLDQEIAAEIVTIAKNTDLDDIDESLLRSPEISKKASIVAQLKGVREVVTAQQRKLANNQGVVLEGRDAGTVVFPEAECKFFLTASMEERAKRRGRDLNTTDLAQVEADIRERDRLDTQRIYSPLAKTKGTIEIDTTGLSINEVLSVILKQVNKFVKGA